MVFKVFFWYFMVDIFDMIPQDIEFTLAKVLYSVPYIYIMYIKPEYLYPIYTWPDQAFAKIILASLPFTLGLTRPSPKSSSPVWPWPGELFTIYTGSANQALLEKYPIYI